MRDVRPSEGRPSEGRPSEGRPSEGRHSEGRHSEGRPSEGRPSEGRHSEGRPSECRPSEGRPSRMLAFTELVDSRFFAEFDPIFILHVNSENLLSPHVGTYQNKFKDDLQNCLMIAGRNKSMYHPIIFLEREEARFLGRFSFIRLGF